MERHSRDAYYVVHEGIVGPDRGKPSCKRPSTIDELRNFRFSRLVPHKGKPLSEELRTKLAVAMTAQAEVQDDPGIPAGFTYLGQFVDHDLTMDRTRVSLGDQVSVDDLLQGRSPALDLDSLYGLGPRHPDGKRFYEADGAHLTTGSTVGVGFPAERPIVQLPLAGFDLPRVGVGSTKAERRAPAIPDERNDENLAIAQLHSAFIRFHNGVVDQLTTTGIPNSLLFEAARDIVVRHYQWMLRTDFLPRIVDPDIVDRVFTRGRRFFELPEGPNTPYPSVRGEDTPTMPIEFSVAAYRLGHSLVREAYQWNAVFNSDGPGGPGTLPLLFRFSGTSGNLTPPGVGDGDDLDDPNSGLFLRLPTNWVADFRRLFDFGPAGIPELVVPPEQFNFAQRINTLLVDPLKDLPQGAFGERGQKAPTAIRRNLAFRNLTRAVMVELCTGQQAAEYLKINPLSREQILQGNGGAALDLTPDEADALAANTPLWFYILREAEVNPVQSGRLTGVGGNIVAEVFHRAMEGSRSSIVKDPAWRPTLTEQARQSGQFTMVDLLLFAFEGKADLLNPIGK